MTTFFEHIREGGTYKSGSRTVTKEEIREFAKKYAPQPLHVDEGAAEDSFFGTLVASGMHTLAECVCIAVDEYYTDVANVARTRMDEVRFSKPLRPGDTLTVSSEILEKSPTHSPNL